MNNPKLTLKFIFFTGPKVKPAGLDFTTGLNLIYGASNTGKSFTLKSIDFMLGGKTPLPDFKEIQGYEKIWLGVEIEGIGAFTISRAVKGGNFILFNGLSKNQPSDIGRILDKTHDANNQNNLSNFLLTNLGFANKHIVKNVKCEQVNLSFRDLAHVLLTDETSIQSESSPVETGQKVTQTKERGVFRLLLTGLDDSALVSSSNNITTKASKAANIKMLDQMIASVDLQIEKHYTIENNLPIQRENLKKSLEDVQSQLDNQQKSIKDLLKNKNALAIEIPKVEERLNEIKLHVERFSNLNKIYISDIERLESLEEVGFLLSLGKDRPCYLCGAPPEAQIHKNEFGDIDLIHDSTVAEIKKIKQQQDDLSYAVLDLKNEKIILEKKYSDLISQLKSVETEIQLFSPKESKLLNEIKDIFNKLEYVNNGLTLVTHRGQLINKKEEVKKFEISKKSEKMKLELPPTIAHEFCQLVSDVLVKWGFPGQHHVSFDKDTYDLLIDGTPRINNGKGVRALVHAAFKVSLLLFCHQKGLSNPGFLILDTPLLTYRDPIKTPAFGDLSEDEKALAQTDVKQRFFDHLASIKHIGQFIVIENIDPPNNIDELAHHYAFYGKGGKGRNGFF